MALLSDLHLSVAPLDIAAPAGADVIVLAGDLHRPEPALAWARRFADGRPTLFVAGNHEFYGSDLDATLAALRTHAAGSGVTVLECEAWRGAGLRFLGCTLWADYRGYASRAERSAALVQAATLVRDFSRIRAGRDGDAPFTPAVSRRRFDRSVRWLEREFAASDEPTVVVTHFGPSPGSVAPRFAGSPLNACFVSNLDEQIRRWQPLAWLHGHVHDSFDYRLGATRVVANPRGYAPKGVPENPRFDPALCLQIDAGAAPARGLQS